LAGAIDNNPVALQILQSAAALLKVTRTRANEEEALFSVISFIDKRDEAGVFSGKEEIVRRATCKFVRNFRPPLALAPSKQEKQGTGKGEGGRRGGESLEEDEELEMEEDRRGCFLFLALGDLCARNRAPPVEMKRREEKG